VKKHATQASVSSFPNIQFSIRLGFAIHDVFFSNPHVWRGPAAYRQRQPLFFSLTTVSEVKKNLPALRLPSFNVNITGFLCNAEQFN
jgi:hypothetical protein